MRTGNICGIFNLQISDGIAQECFGPSMYCNHILMLQILPLWLLILPANNIASYMFLRH
jgi:hypothetical protein